MLQIVYHAPPYLSRDAAKLLRAFRSSAVLPELRAIALDETQHFAHRADALRAIASIRGDLLLDDFKPVAEAAFAKRDAQWKQYCEGTLTRLLHPPDFLDDLVYIAANHPSNRGWFFSLMEAVDSAVQVRFLKHQLGLPDLKGFQTVVIERLLDLIEDDPQGLGRMVSFDLVYHGGAVDGLPDSDFDRIVALCLTRKGDTPMVLPFFKWPRLEAAVNAAAPDWDTTSPYAFLALPPTHAYRSSPAYAYLLSLYDRAAQGDEKAFKKLKRIITGRKKPDALRATATHFIGKLGSESPFPVHLTLSALLRGFYEAGEGMHYEAGKAPARHADSHDLGSHGG